MAKSEDVEVLARDFRHMARSRWLREEVPLKRVGDETSLPSNQRNI